MNYPTCTRCGGDTTHGGWHNCDLCDDAVCFHCAYDHGWADHKDQLLSLEECLEILKPIYSGADPIDWSKSDKPDDIYAGNMTYYTQSGTKLVVFNDCDSWDYIDDLVAPDGRRAPYSTHAGIPHSDPTEEEMARLGWNVDRWKQSSDSH